MKVSAASPRSYSQGWDRIHAKFWDADQKRKEELTARCQDTNYTRQEVRQRKAEWMRRFRAARKRFTST